MEGESESVSVEKFSVVDLVDREPLLPDLVKNPDTGRKAAVFFVSLVVVVMCVIGFGIIVTFRHKLSIIIDEPKFTQRQIPTATWEEIKNSIERQYDPDANPCEDFYQFSCGKVLESNASVLSALSQQEEDLPSEIKDLLNDTSINTTSRAFQQAKLVYATCVQDSTKNASEKIANILDFSLVGQWPILHSESWNDSSYNLEDLLLQLFEYKVPNVVEMKIVQYFSDLRLSISMGKTVTSLENLISDDKNRGYTQTYETVILKIVALFLNVDVENLKTSVRRDVQNIIEFERKIAQIINNSSCVDGLVSDLQTSIPVTKLDQVIPEVNWKLLIQNILDTVIQMPPTEFTYTEIFVICPNDLMEIAELAKSADKRIVKNYLIWRFVLEYLSFMGKTFENISFELYFGDLGLFGFPKFAADLEGWSQCADWVNQFFNDAVTHAYLHKHPKYIEGKAIVEDMASYLQKAVNMIINSSEQLWIKDSVLQLLNKVSTTVLDIGYPSFFLDADAVDKQYEGLVVYENSTFRNYLELIKHTNWREFRMKLTEGKDPYRFWYLTPLLQGNAFNMEDQNDRTVVIPVSLLRDPFFNKDYPMYWNFAKLGTIIGHEIAHSLNPADFKSIFFEQPDDLLQCYVNQYERFAIQNLGMKMDGKNKLDENLSDNLGLKMSWLGYTLWKNDSYDRFETTVPGWNYTIPQLFYLMYSQMWCENLNVTEISIQMADTHSLGEFRVKGPLENNIDFGSTFNCPSDSPMNPSAKCHLWGTIIENDTNKYDHTEAEDIFSQWFYG